MKKNKIIMNEAREALAGKWGLAIITYLLYGIINRAVGPLSLVIGGPLAVGAATFSLTMSRGKEAEIMQVFDGFKKFEKALVAFLLMLLYIILWTLLLIIPGIIAAIAYSQTFYILVDDDKITASGAIKKSTEMMKGNKWKYVCLFFRFTGWFLASILTFGIGFLWLTPYMQISFAKFYEDIK